MIPVATTLNWKKISRPCLRAFFAESSPRFFLPTSPKIARSSFYAQSDLITCRPLRTLHSTEGFIPVYTCTHLPRSLPESMISLSLDFQRSPHFELQNRCGIASSCVIITASVMWGLFFTRRLQHAVVLLSHIRFNHWNSRARAWAYMPPVL